MSGTKKGKRTRDKSLLNIVDDSSSNDNDVPELPSILAGKGYCGESPACKSQEQDDDTEGSSSRKTFRVEPPSALLSRLQSFLPQIAEANKKLKDDMAEDPSKVDIENVDDSANQYIEMDLGLGVFDMKPKKKSNPEDIVISTHADADISESDSSDYDDSDSDTGKRQQQSIRGLPGSKIIIDPAAASIASKRQGKKPHIEVLDNSKQSGGENSRMNDDSESDSDQEMHE
ncbi:hypothetical protein LPJ72_003202 [Coemansia sp. Benny D160-2]|nr:hypothetical protein LPJ72_003202 [Coemansia sp. Benny D160-2]